VSRAVQGTLLWKPLPLPPDTHHPGPLVCQGVEGRPPTHRLQPPTPFGKRCTFPTAHRPRRRLREERRMHKSSCRRCTKVLDTGHLRSHHPWIAANLDRVKQLEEAVSLAEKAAGLAEDAIHQDAGVPRPLRPDLQDLKAKVGADAA
jgi:hypothetical protein